MSSKHSDNKINKRVVSAERERERESLLVKSLGGHIICYYYCNHKFNNLRLQ